MHNCKYCNEKNVEAEHEISGKHIRNKALFEYAANKNIFYGNRKGAHVSCDVKSSFTTNSNCVSPKIQISAKPGEEVKFVFTIMNEMKAETINIAFVQMMETKLNFVMNKHKLKIGSTPQALQPKSKVKEEVSVSFKSQNIGQYETPIVFYFQKKGNNEIVVIIRDMVVFVEERQLTHEKKVSPYACKEVNADKLVRCSAGGFHNDDMFRIPKNFKRIYASNLQVSKDADQIEQDLNKDINQILKTGATKDNYIKFFHNLLWYEETKIRLNLKRYNMSGVTLGIFNSNNKMYSLYVPGLAEKRPSLMLGDLLFVKPQACETTMFEARVAEINDNEALIGYFHPSFAKHYQKDAKFDIRFFMSRIPLERMHQAVHRIKEVGHETKLFPVPNKNVTYRKPKLEFYNTQVAENPEQRSAVEHIVAGTAGSAPYLLHGPPGTGKTVTIVEAILQLVNKDPSNRVLVCTDSNMAADHVASLLIKYTHLFTKRDKLILRANSQFRVWSTLPDCLARYSNGTCRDDFKPVSINDFMSYNIVVTTLSHSAKFARQLRSHQLNSYISHLFIDEAAQASEPACLIPAAGLLARAGALVLAGDPYQLGPVVISPNVAKLGLGMSLMERLMKECPMYGEAQSDANYCVMLRNNFRSHPDILDIPDKLFYRGQLRALADEDKLSSVDILGERMESRAIMFHGVLSKEQKMGKSPSYFNNMEAEIVYTYVSFLTKKHRVMCEDIGIVTPYVRQVYTINKGLRELGYYKVEVGTVEAFQGKEKRVILISTVRANCNLLAYDAKFQLGFLVDDKRFNVALTRGKAKVIIIGNPLCLQKDVKWKMFMQRCRGLGTYHGFDYETIATQDDAEDATNKITPLMKELLNISKKEQENNNQK